MIGYSYAVARKIIVGVIGFSVLIVGIAMIILPGPAVIVIPLGLLILASEFLWAKKWLDRIKSQAQKIKGKILADGPTKNRTWA